jgi:uncharacterized membrane protein
MIPGLPGGGDAVLEAARSIPWPFVMAFASLLVIFLVFQRRHDVLQEVSFTHREVAVLCLGSIAGWAVNVPVIPMGSSFLAVNLGGALVPLVLAGLWWSRGHLPPVRTAVGVTLVAAIAYSVTSFEPSVGVVAVFPWFLLPSLAALGYALTVSYQEPVTSVPLAYTAGSLGALIGADVVRLPEIVAAFATPSAEVSLVSIGGAGVFDMVFLAGALAMAFDLGIVALAVRQDPDPRLAYPGDPVLLLDDETIMEAYQDLEDTNPFEEAVGALAASNRALRAGSHAVSLRLSFVAVDSLVRSGEPPLLERLAWDGVADATLVQDLRELARVYRAAEDPGRVEAGQANQAAKLLVGAIGPRTGLRMRVEVS